MFISVRIKKIAIPIILFLIVAIIMGVLFIPSFAKEEIKKMNSVPVPILMYHSILKDEARWNDYVLSPVELEKDIVWLKEHGYRTVFVSELVDYVNGDGKLPEKPVILSFDDGTYNNYTYVLPLLKKYDCKATISIVGSFSEFACEEAEPSPTYSYLDWDDIKDMRKSGKVEIANHTYNMHCLGERRGIAMKNGECYEDYRHAFLADMIKTQHLLEDNCGFTPNVFTYPYGITCDAGKRLVKNAGFLATLGVESRINYISKENKDCLFDMGRFNRPSFISTEDFMKKCGIK